MSWSHERGEVTKHAADEVPHLGRDVVRVLGCGVTFLSSRHRLK